MRFRPFFLLPFTLAITAAQTLPLEYAGKPMRVPFQCSEEDIRTYGLTCPPEHPCPVFLELAGLEVVGNRLFVSGNLHADTATISSILLASQDSGKTWTEPHERLAGAGLELIQFLDFENEWVGGHILATSTRDPFLLLTHDGGKTWYRRPVFSEGRTAALDSFRFDSKSHGWMWLDRSQAGEAEDRFESLESDTGGDSWSVRETSAKPLRKEGKPAGPAEWRLHPDPSTKAYRLQHKGPSGWETVAAFLVRTGECRETEATFAAPPTVESEENTDQPAAPAKPPSLRKP